MKYSTVVSVALLPTSHRRTPRTVHCCYFIVVDLRPLICVLAPIAQSRGIDRLDPGGSADKLETFSRWHV